MHQADEASYTAFAGSRRIASGTLTEVALTAKEMIEGGEQAPVLIFDDATSRVIDVDFRGTGADVAARLSSGSSDSPRERGPTEGREGGPPRGRGRPKLGVVSREVTLLPRHWDWLNVQPGGASAAVRRLVDEARRTHAGRGRVREAQEAAYRFMSAMAGDAAGFEEATRALFAGNQARFDELTGAWPADVRDHARRLASAAFAPRPTAGRSA